MKDTSTNTEGVTNEGQIVYYKGLYEEVKRQLDALREDKPTKYTKSDCSDQMAFEAVYQEKDELIKSLRKTIEDCDGKLCNINNINANSAKLIRPEIATDMFRSKPTGRSAKNLMDINLFKCEFPDCN